MAIQNLQPVSFDKQPEIEQASLQLQKEQQDLVQIQAKNSQEVKSQTANIDQIQKQIQTLENQRNGLKAKLESIRADFIKINAEIDRKKANFESDYNPKTDQDLAENKRSQGKETRKDIANISVEIIKKNNILKTEQTSLDQIKAQNSQELNKETSEVKNAKQNLEAQKILQMNQQRKTAEANAGFQKSQVEITQQKAQKQQEVAKILEDGNKEIIEAQERLAQLVTQNKATKAESQAKLEQIGGEKITQTSKLIISTFESFGVKVEPLDTKGNQDRVIFRAKGNLGGINAAKEVIRRQTSTIDNIDFKILSQTLTGQTFEITSGN